MVSVEVLRLGYCLLEQLGEAIQSLFDTTDGREDKSTSAVDFLFDLLGSRAMKTLR